MVAKNRGRTKNKANRLPEQSAPRRSDKTGLAAGALVHVGRRKMEMVKVTGIEYDQNGYFDQWDSTDVGQISAAIESEPISWINVAGLHEVELIEAIGRAAGIHPLLLEDMLNTQQRPKYDEQGNHLIMIVKLLHSLPDTGQIETEQISIVLGPRYVLTFQEHEADIFDPIRERIRAGNGRLRQSAVDYLAYMFLDTIVDHYFNILEHLGEQIEAVEDEVVATPTNRTLQHIHDLKQVLLHLRRSVWPLREVLGRLHRGESPLFQEATLIYLRDVYEHTIQVIDTIETFRDIVSGLLDIYLSSISNRMNEVMKVLTVIATIFIPLTFITSLYGMNFRFMPELEWRWGYPSVLLLMLIMAGGMLLYFRKKDWL